MPGQGSPLVSASGQVFCLQVAIAFSCPLGALLALLYERSVVLFGGRSSLLLGRLDLRLDPSGLTVHSVSTSVAFHRHWLVPSVPDQPLGPSVRCFLNFILATFNTNLMVYFILVTSWLRVLG